MPKSPDSPIFQFLTQKENLPAVLEVARYTQEIREYVAERFWNSLEEVIRKNPKAKDGFSWERRLPDRSDREFFLIARPPALPVKGQGLRYRIETAADYFGFGLNWNEDARQIEKLCQLQSVKTLQAKLKERSGDIDPKPNTYWLWWEYWQRNPYTDSDPWSWFASDFDDRFFSDKAERFWDFVLPIHPLVLEANKALSRSRA